MDCPLCTQIAKAIRYLGTLEVFDEVAVGTCNDLRESCKTCQTCLAVLSKLSQDTTIASTPDESIYVFNRRHPECDFQIATDSQAHAMVTYELGPIQSVSHICPSVGIEVDNNWIDTHRLMSWLNCCDNTHGDSCLEFPGQANIEPPQDLLLIDVQDECLVEVPQAFRYFTLSYVWGKHAGNAVFETRTGNLSEHKKKGSLDQGKIDLPETIKDSMRLVKRLNERYLWVDRLCIVQDDLIHKSRQIAQMGAIYAFAYCTIIAAAGTDANHGLLGVGGGSKPRNFLQPRLNFPGAPCFILDGLHKKEQLSHWNTRGWTYQEKMLSRRALVFVADSVMWRCQHNIWREDMTADPDGDARPNLKSMDVFYRYPDLIQWAYFINKYNRRNFTYESDRLAAIAGLENVLSFSFPSGFVYGLPSFFFDIALLWNPAKPMERRSAGSGNSAIQLPSWSWLGWHGALDTDAIFSGYDYLYDSNVEYYTSCITMPLVTWYVHDHSGRRIKVNNSYGDWRSLATRDGTLPPGWAELQEGSQKKYIHPAFPDIKFNWPIPIPAGSGAASPASQSLSHYLSFRSHRGYLTISGQVCQETKCIRTYMQCLTVSLETLHGAWAGILRLNQPISSPVPTGLACELVVISKSRVDNTAEYDLVCQEEWKIADRPKEGPYYEFYNVLWVERDGENVYRKALGRVEKRVWDGLELEECDFILC